MQIAFKGIIMSEGPCFAIFLAGSFLNLTMTGQFESRRSSNGLKAGGGILSEYDKRHSTI